MTYRNLLTACCSAVFLAACASDEPAETEQLAATSEPAAQAAGSPATQPATADAATESTPESSMPESSMPKKEDADMAASTPSQPEVPPGTASAQPVALSLGPGQARVTASVVSLETQGTSHICTIKIGKVHGYGSSSKPLAAGNEIRVIVKSAQIEKAGTKAQALLTVGSSIDVTMRYQKPPAMSANNPSWSVVEIH
ncbi:MAG: hypothetical protein HOH43_22310 [Candidatus Latescibacteria bacterium]|jgi:hypothetical protein|nr:hypothetical protein [Candidatus Latescibacterota bacterium]